MKRPILLAFVSFFLSVRLARAQDVRYNFDSQQHGRGLWPKLLRLHLAASSSGGRLHRNGRPPTWAFFYLLNTE
jgi:hypothetical protein